MTHRKCPVAEDDSTPGKGSDSLGGLWRQAKTAGDYASIIVGGTAGLAVDALVFTHSGIPQGTATVIGAGGLFGLKKTWDAGRAAAKQQKAARKARGRAEKLLASFTADGYDEGVQFLNTQLDWHTTEIITNQELNEAILAARTDFLAWQKRKGTGNE